MIKKILRWFIDFNKACMKWGFDNAYWVNPLLKRIGLGIEATSSIISIMGIGFLSFKFFETYAFNFLSFTFALFIFVQPIVIMSQHTYQIFQKMKE